MAAEMMESDGIDRCDSPEYPCPSFNSYSSGGLVDVASRVCREEELGSRSELDSCRRDTDHAERSDDDFEFVSLVKEPDQVLLGGGYSGPVFPVFDRDLLFDGGEGGYGDEDGRSIRIPLKNLFQGDGDRASCSSSEADELDGVPEGTYCVWRPRSPAVEQTPGRCKKSNSTGSGSKRWRFRDLLRRSNSDGKDSFVFLTPFSSSAPITKAPEPKAGGGAGARERRHSADEPRAPVKQGSSNKAAAAAAAKNKASAPSAHESFYVRSRAMKEGDRRRSFLPYRKDLVGFFANVNGLGRSFPPF